MGKSAIYEFWITLWPNVTDDECIYFYRIVIEAEMKMKKNKSEKTNSVQLGRSIWIYRSYRGN